MVNSDEVKAEVAKQGLAMRPGAPAQLGALIKSDIQRWQKVVVDH